ncbi:MAG: DUF6092 family protein [Candidatus Bathyarchaeia archaeon]
MSAKKAIYEYLAYLSSSAMGLLGEPVDYGPLRLLDAMRRFIDLIISLNLPIDKETVKDLVDLREKITSGMALRRANTVEFEDFLRKLNRELAMIVLKTLEESSHG